MAYLITWNSKGSSIRRNYINKEFDTLPQAKRYLAKYLADRHMDSGSILIASASRIIKVGTVEVTYSGIGVYIDDTGKASIIR